MEHNRVVYEKPYDSEIEYLESGNTQFIDTGIIATNNTNFKLKVYTDSKQRQILGQYEVVNNNYLAFGVYYFNNSNKLVLYGVNSTYLSTRGGISGRLVEMKLHDNQFTIDSYAFNVTRNNIIKNKTLYLFKMNGIEITPNSHLKMYYCKIWNGDTLVRDFIPVRRGSVGYMYDRVSGKLFGNKGTGNFILGPDVANPVPNIRRVFRFDNKRFVMPMHYDRRVEYLESTGTQWIDTGYIANVNTEIHTEFSLNNKNSFGLYGRSKKSQDSGIRFFGTSKIYVNHGGGRIEQSNNLIINTRYTVVHKHNSITLNSVEYKTGSGRLYPNVTFSICMESGVPSNQTIYFLIGKVYSFDILENGTLIRSFIPVRRGNIGYMYDRVSGKLFGNSGTGQFILGNDIN